jgi:hypothetical protein
MAPGVCLRDGITAEDDLGANTAIGCQQGWFCFGVRLVPYLDIHLPHR